MPLVEIRMLEGRGAEEKRDLLSAVTKAVQESTGSPLERIRVWIQEIPRAEYMIGGKTADER